MKVYFDIPTAEHRGWPGTANLKVKPGALVIQPCNQSYGFTYILEVGPAQLGALAWSMAAKQVRQKIVIAWILTRGHSILAARKVRRAIAKIRGRTA